MLNNGFQFYPGKRLPVVCRDGVIRQAVRTGTGLFSICPGSVQISSGGKRRTISGFIDLEKKTFEGKGLNAALLPVTSHRRHLAPVALRLIKATAYGRGAPGYIWDYAADHAAALAAGCRHYYGTAQWPEGGFAARAVLKRLPPELLPRLALYFDKLAGLYRLFDPIDQSPVTPPPPPPPIE